MSTKNKSAGDNLKNNNRGLPPSTTSTPMPKVIPPKQVEKKSDS
jgi:hypothetical protein